MKILRLLLCLFAGTIAVRSAPTVAETVTVGGVGSLTPVVKLLGAEFTKKNPGFDLRVIEPPMGSGGGIRALAAGEIDVALSARSVNRDETGTAIPWLQTALVLATKDGKVDGLSRVQIADIYAGRRLTWDDGKLIRLVLRGTLETETKVLRSMGPTVDVAVSDSFKRPGLPIAENDPEALDLLGKIPGSLGTTNLGLIKTTDARVTALPIDGVSPSIRTLENGSYPWRRHFYLITSPRVRPDVSAFVIWLNSESALAVLRRLDFLPFRQ